MNKLLAIIPSRTASNLAASIPAVRKHEPEARIIVVDNDPTSAVYSVCTEHACERVQWNLPFVFAGAVNAGMHWAGEDSDVVLLNDDAILETPGGFSIMQAAAEDPQIGIIGAVTDLTGQPLQCRRRNLAIEETARSMPGVGVRAIDHIAFVCVLIPARTRRILAEKTEQANLGLELLGGLVSRPGWARPVFTGGFLDERYTEYGSDDLDYCWQCQRAALCVCVHDGCYVNHGSLRSSYRGAPTTAGDIWPNHRILRAKWGMPPNPADPEQRRRT